MKKVFFILILILILSTFFRLNVFAESTDNSISVNIDDYLSTEKENDIKSGGGDSDEEWYNTGTNLPHSVDYSESNLISILKPGDLIYEDSGSGGLTGHSAIVEGIFYDATYNQYYVRTMEAVSVGVSRGIMTPNRFTIKKASIYRLNNVTTTQVTGAINFYISQLGKNYFIAAWKNPYTTNTRWYCSELLWAAYYWQGIYLDDDDNDPYGSVVYPREIRDYEDATLIMDYRYTTTINNITSTSHTICCNGEYFIEDHSFSALNSCVDVCNVCSYQAQHHNYEYEWINYIRHSAECNCGDSHIQIHVTTGIPVSPGSPYSTCILCGGLALFTMNSPLYSSEIRFDNYSIDNISNHIVPLTFLRRRGLRYDG